MVGERNNVVVHYKDGTIVKGYTHDFLPERPIFHLHVQRGTEAGKVREIKTQDLKAVFFTKTYEGNKEYQEKKRFEEIGEARFHGIKIKVQFKDGEIIRGISLGYNKMKKGFFIVPLDPLSNNERIYVVADAAANIAVGAEAEE